MKRLVLGFVALLAFSSALSANDTVAEIGAGGLEYVRSDKISMVREDLYISMDEVRVDYVFRNHSEENIVALVAFPMPDLEADPFNYIAVPVENNYNFVGFSVSIDGVEISPKLQRRISVAGVDMTNELASRGIPLLHTAFEVSKMLESLGERTLSRFEQLGLIQIDIVDFGKGEELQISPLWTLHSTFYWEMKFPAGREINVSHTYKPAVGATAGMMPFFQSADVSVSGELADKYCIDEGFARAVRGRIEAGVQMEMSWLSYILVTGQNWRGNIGTFHLTVDKGRPENLVSFCGEGVSKTGPTTFELTIEDFYPEQNLDVLFLKVSEY